MLGLDTTRVLLITLNLYLPAGAAKATPPLGPLLGQYGVNTVQFCSEFNTATEGLSLFFDDSMEDLEVKVTIYIYDDRKCTFSVDKPTTSFLLRCFSGVKKGDPKARSYFISKEVLVKIAFFKYPELRLYSACKMIRGTARSIGIQVR